MARREFDKFAGSYDELLKDPIRDRFTAGGDFFHRRKRDLIRNWITRSGESRNWRYLDLGCGRGELLTLLREDFKEVAGVDPSSSMMEGIENVTTRVQEDPQKIPFGDGYFDFVTAVCVYHHVPVAERHALTLEVRRVLRPGGLFCIIEHNPWNPITRLIVSRTPVDADAILLSSRESASLLRGSGFDVQGLKFFLYFPEAVYRHLGIVENAFSGLPFGGQYAILGRSGS